VSKPPIFRTVGDSLLWDILRHPSDDALRLIYADWLEETNGPLNAIAQSIMEGIENPHHITKGRSSLCGLTDDDLVYVDWRRGFPWAITCPYRTFLDNAEAIFRVAPIEAVWISDKQPVLRAGTWRWGIVETSDYRHLIGPPIGGHLGTTNGATEVVGDAMRWGWMYESPEAAMGDLGVACVKYGRTLAGLEEAQHA
jgi:uncharacterized protein (TIGR02996 family)